MQAGRAMGGFVTHPQALEGQKVRERGEKFFDHFSQATMFWNSQSAPEKEHLVRALRFELGKVEAAAVRERMVGLLAHVDRGLATRVAEGLGLSVPVKLDGLLNRSVPADADVKNYQPRDGKPPVPASAALSMANTIKDTAKTRKVAILAADGVDGKAVNEMKRQLTAAGALAKVVAPRGGTLKAADGAPIAVDFSLLTVGSVLFDAVFVPGGEASVSALRADAMAVHFLNEAYKHCKAIAATGAGAQLLPAPSEDRVASKKGKSDERVSDPGLVVGGDGQVAGVAATFLKAIAQHRNWSREAIARTVSA